MVNNFYENYWNFREPETISWTHFKLKYGQFPRCEQNFKSSY